MRFSIRGMILFTTVAALAAVLWQRSDRLRALHEKLQLTEAEVKQLELVANAQDPERKQMFAAMRDDFQEVDRLRVAAESTFSRLRKKYGQVEPRGEQVVSLRGVPSLSPSAGGLAPVEFRFWVPRKREVWLLFGIVEADDSGTFIPKLTQLLQHTPLEASGPYACQLPLGESSLRIAVGQVSAGQCSVQVTLNDDVLLRTVYRSAELHNAGLSYLSGTVQQDVAPDKDLPGLLKANFKEQDNRIAHELRVWLSAESLGLRMFPGVAARKEQP